MIKTHHKIKICFKSVKKECDLKVGLQGISKLKGNWTECCVQGLDKFGTTVSFVMLKRQIVLKDSFPVSLTFFVYMNLFNFLPYALKNSLFISLCEQNEIWNHLHKSF